MNTTVGIPADSCLGRALARYLNRVDERGSACRPAIREEVLAEFVEVAESLRKFFADEDQIESGRGKVLDCDIPVDETRNLPNGVADKVLNQPDGRASGLPAVIGRYFIRKELGDGHSGQGRVLLALHPTLDRDVAIKICRSSSHQTADNELLLAEGRVLGQLDHPHLAKIYDLDFHEGCPYLVMEFVRGKTLAQAVRHSRLSPVKIAELLAKVSHGVAAAHARGIVHQDLKPQNIVLDEHGEPRVIDFGMARIQSAWESSLNVTGGTAEYMAPEQAAEFLTGNATGDADPRRDIFSLGAVLYFLLTGSPPFQGPDTASRLRAARDCSFGRHQLRSPAIPFHLARICLRAMAKQPEHRPESAAELAQQLESFIKRQQRPRRLLAASALTVVLILGGVSYAVWGKPKVVQDRPSRSESPSKIQPDVDSVSVSKLVDPKVEEPVNAASPAPADPPNSDSASDGLHATDIGSTADDKSSMQLEPRRGSRDKGLFRDKSKERVDRKRP